MLNKNNKNFIGILKEELSKRDNPADMKTAIIGKIVQLSPIIVSINEGLILLEEDDELEISEWFRFRCDIDKTKALSQTVPDKISSSNSNCSSAEGASETHSYTGTPCNLVDSAIKKLSSAIKSTNAALSLVNGELLALKCVLALGDYVVVASLEENGKYILLDKVI